MPIDASTWIQVTVPPNPSAAATVPTVSLTFTGRILGLDGTLAYCRWDESFSLASGLTFSSDLAPGYLVSLTVTCNTPGVVDGMVYTIVGLTHQPNVGAPLDTLLIASYVSSAAPCGWPCGFLRTVSDGQGFYFAYKGTAPAAGSPWYYTVTDAYLMLQLISFELTTNATAASRIPYVDLILPGPFYVQVALSGGSEPASTSYYWNIGVDLPNMTAAVGAIITVSLLAGLVLNAGTQIGVVVQNMQAGDTITGPAIIGRAWV